MNRGARKQAIFLGEEDRVGFLRLLAVAHDRFGIEVNAFALMGNHYHVFARSREGRLSSAFHYIDGVFAQRFNRRHGFDGPLFRGRFLSRIVDSEGYLHRVVRYVHRNPVDAELVGSPEDWKWSSYPIFANSWRQRPHWLYDDALRLSGIRTAAQLQQDTVQRVDIPPMPPHDTSAAAVGSAE
ncbi:MAG: transposase, partial [Acidimicrobiia bacterium]|nr:transposase [Acidimicrobiia bacterium]